MKREIKFSELSLKEKIGQIVIVSGDRFNKKFAKLGIGGILPSKLHSEEEYKNWLKRCQDISDIKLLKPDISRIFSFEFGYSVTI